MAASTIAASSVAGQSVRPRISPDSAATIRADLVRPPAKPSSDFIDVVEFPFKVALYPLVLLTRTATAAAGLASLENPPFPIAQIRSARAWGLSSHIRAIGPNSGPALRLRLDRFRPFVAETGISIVGSQKHRVAFELGQGPDGLTVAYEFRRDAEDDFWGVGSRTQKADRSDFLRDRQELTARARVHVGSVVRLTGGVAYEDNRIDRGKDAVLPDAQDTFGSDGVAGLGGRTRYVRFDAAATLDFTHLKDFQPRGVSLRLGSSLFRATDSSDADFNRITAELHGYVPVNAWQYVAVRGLVQRNRLDQGTGIPFFDLARFGGSLNGPRGFSSGRFRDRDGVSLMVEWRYEIWEDVEQTTRAEAFLLFDEGGVTRSLSSLSSADLRTSYGFGLRVVDRQGLLGLAYIAFSHEGTQVTISTQWPF